MNDYGKAVLEQYELEVEHVKRGRGCLVCDTNDGIKKLQEYQGSKNHLEMEYQVLCYLKKQNLFDVDCYVKNKEGMLCATHPSQTTYVLKDWLEGEECNKNKVEDLTKAVSVLAYMHRLLREHTISRDVVTVSSPILHDYEKHLKEMKRIRQYIRNKNKRNEFETYLLDTSSESIQQAEDAIERMKQSTYMQMYEKAKEQVWICHGSYHYHNVIFTGANIMITNFEKCNVQVQLVDLYLFMRKALEKNSWDKEVGNKMLEAYDKVFPLTEEDLEVLGILFLYPEKYWKQMNFYYNRKKNWIPVQMLEKVQKIARQQEQIQRFICVGLNLHY